MAGLGGVRGGACTHGNGEQGRGCPPQPNRERAPGRVSAGARARAGQQAPELVGPRGSARSPRPM